MEARSVHLVRDGIDRKATLWCVRAVVTYDGVCSDYLIFKSGTTPLRVTTARFQATCKVCLEESVLRKTSSEMGRWRKGSGGRNE